MTDIGTGDLEVNRCFVVGPIGQKFAPQDSEGREIYEQALEVFENVIQPACHKFGIEPVRADQIAATGEITEQVFRHLYEDEVVIADVSGGNPNVMYELGLRHTRPLLTIQIGEFGQLPFDLAAVRTIQFSRSERGLIDARKALERALAAGLSDEPEPLTPTRVWNSMPATDSALETHVLPVAPDADPDADTVDDAGFMDQLAAIEDKMPILSDMSEGIGHVLETIGAIAEDNNLGFTADGNTSAKARLALVARFASELQPPADELVSQTDSFYAQMASINDDVLGLLAYIDKHPTQFDDDSKVDSFLDSITGMTRSAREANANIAGFGVSVGKLGDVSRVLRRPARLLVHAVETMSKAIALTDEWEAAAKKIQKKR
ncbi:hypothetical protein [Clavibacter michiganensis]|uniref:hypothetical protein n=1 Tax=Clavibacter michiganensis TaxID=28447 RepID=UPI00292E0CFC|nr:hypothetical protein [Clavibacter michiganensis]